MQKIKRIKKKSKRLYYIGTNYTVGVKSVSLSKISAVHL